VRTCTRSLLPITYAYEAYYLLPPAQNIWISEIDTGVYICRNVHATLTTHCFVHIISGSPKSRQVYVYVYVCICVTHRAARLTANCLIHRMSGFPKSALAYVYHIYVYLHPTCMRGSQLIASCTKLWIFEMEVYVYIHIYIYVVHAKCVRDLQHIAKSTEFLNFLELTKVIIYVNMHMYLTICRATKHTCV